MNKIVYVILGSFLLLAGTTAAGHAQWHRCGCTTTSTTTTVPTTSTTTAIQSNYTSNGQTSGGATSSGGLPCYTCSEGLTPVYYWNVFTGTVWVYYPATQFNLNTQLNLTNW